MQCKIFQSNGSSCPHLLHANSILAYKSYIQPGKYRIVPNLNNNRAYELLFFSIVLQIAPFINQSTQAYSAFLLKWWSNNKGLVNRFFEQVRYIPFRPKRYSNIKQPKLRFTQTHTHTHTKTKKKKVFAEIQAITPWQSSNRPSWNLLAPLNQQHTPEFLHRTQYFKKKDYTILFCIIILKL